MDESGPTKLVKVAPAVATLNAPLPLGAGLPRPLVVVVVVVGNGVFKVSRLGGLAIFWRKFWGRVGRRAAAVATLKAPFPEKKHLVGLVGATLKDPLPEPKTLPGTGRLKWPRAPGTGRLN